MVSEEIANEIDEQQFEEEESSQEIPSAVSEIIVIQFESQKKDLIIPGLLQKYKFQEIKEFQDNEKLFFQFITDPINTTNIHANLSCMERVTLTRGGKNVDSRCLKGLRIAELGIEQSAANAGCIITIVYK